MRLRAREVYSPTLAAAAPRNIEPSREKLPQHEGDAAHTGAGSLADGDVVGGLTFEGYGLLGKVRE